MDLMLPRSLFVWVYSICFICRSDTRGNELEQSFEPIGTLYSNSLTIHYGKCFYEIPVLKEGGGLSLIGFLASLNLVHPRR